MNQLPVRAPIEGHPKVVEVPAVAPWRRRDAARTAITAARKVTCFFGLDEDEDEEDEEEKEDGVLFDGDWTLPADNEDAKEVDDDEDNTAFD